MKKGYKVCSMLLLSLTLASTAIVPITPVLANDNISVSNEKMSPVSVDGSRLYVYEGRIYELSEDSPEPTPAQMEVIKTQRGRWSAAAKAIVKVYDKLPTKVKNYINKYIGLRTIAEFIDHYTGWIEDGIYEICKLYGMPDWMARLVAQTITFLVL